MSGATIHSFTMLFGMKCQINIKGNIQASVTPTRVAMDQMWNQADVALLLNEEGKQTRKID